MTALLALILLTPYIAAWNQLLPDQLITNAEIALVGFHTLFNLVGVLVILPLTRQFATLIIRLVPDKATGYTERLDKQLVNDPVVAMSVVDSTIQQMLVALLNHIRALLSAQARGKLINMTLMQQALDKTHAYADLIHIAPDKAQELRHASDIFHILDHMQRLHARCDEDRDRVNRALQEKQLHDFCLQIENSINNIIEALQENNYSAAHLTSLNLLETTHSKMDAIRSNIMTETATGNRDVPDANHALEAVRWLRRVVIHINRGMHHLAGVT